MVISRRIVAASAVNGQGGGKGMRAVTARKNGRGTGAPPVTLNHLLIRCASQQDSAVVKLALAAGRIGLSAQFAALATDVPARAQPPSGEMVVLRCIGDGPEALRTLSRHLRLHPDRNLMVLADDDAQTHEKQLLAEGAAGFIPARFSEEAMAAALLVVRAGEVFAPQARPPHRSTPSLPAATAGVVVRDFGLTKVEREVLALAAQGLTNLEIALRRSGREGTIKVHMNHIFSKLNVRSRVEAIAVYLQTHNVDPEELRRAQSGEMDMKWLLATMTHEHHAKGTVLFRRGQHGDKIYYLQNGLVHLQEIDVDMRPRDLFGEIGVFAHEQKRTCTALCKTDVDLFTLSFDEVRRCYFLNPQFAYYVMYLITNRLMADRDRFQDSID